MSNEAGLGTQLRRLIGELDGAVQEVYDKAGVDFRPRFYPVVQALARDGPLGISELAVKCGVTQPAMTQTVQQMRHAGIIASGAADDQRSRIINLSDAGRSVIASLDRIWIAVESAARELDDELPCGLSTVIGKALDALDRAPFIARIERHL